MARKCSSLYGGTWLSRSSPCLRGERRASCARRLSPLTSLASSAVAASAARWRPAGAWLTLPTGLPLPVSPPAADTLEAVVSLVFARPTRSGIDTDWRGRRNRPNRWGGTWIATDVSGRLLALGALVLRHDARATSCVPSGIRSSRMVVGGSDDPDCGVAVQSACRDRSRREKHQVQLLAFLRPLPHQVDRSAERPAPRLRLHSPRARVRLVPSSAACQRPCPADDPVRHASSKGRPQRLDGEDLWATREGLSTFHTPATSSNDVESTGGGPPLAAQRPHRPQTRLPNLQTVTTPRHPPPQTRRP